MAWMNEQKGKLTQAQVTNTSAGGEESEAAGEHEIKSCLGGQK